MVRFAGGYSFSFPCYRSIRINMSYTTTDMLAANISHENTRNQLTVVATKKYFHYQLICKFFLHNCFINKVRK